MSLMEKENESYARSNFLDLEIEVCKGMCEADSDCTHTETSILFELTIKSARKLVVDPPVMVVWISYVLQFMTPLWTLSSLRRNSPH